MGIFDKKKRTPREEEILRRRREQRLQRIEARENEKRLREELVNNTMYANTKGVKTSAKGFGGKSKNPLKRKIDESKIIDRNNSRKEKRGEKVKFRDLTIKGKMLRIFKWLAIFGITMFALLAIAVSILIVYLSNDPNELTEADLLLTKQNSEVLDRDGKLVAVLAKDEKRKIISLDEMSKYIPIAYTSIEDERFYSHKGIDIKRTIGAAGQYILRRGKSSYGGSTITQQLIKNMTKDDERNWKRKLREFSRAISIENKFSKDQILELYLNLIFVGGSNIHGVALGSNHYFDKSPKDITLAEAAFMAGINHSPSNYSPFKESGKEERMKRINNRTITVLDKMLQLGKVTKEEHDNAVKEVNEGLKFKEGKAAEATQKYSHMVDAAIEEAIERIMEEKDVKKESAELLLYNGGYKIYLTQDNEAQTALEEEMKKEAYKLKSRKEEGKYASAAAIIMDHKNGEIVAAVGGLGEETVMKKGDWNRVTRTQRQNGSSMKPLTVLAAGIETGKLTAGSAFNDSPLMEYKNYTNTFKGHMTLREATAISENIPFIRALRQIGVEKSYEFGKKLGLPLTSADKNEAALALGGLDKGITVKDAVGAYGTIANDGEYIKPTFILKILDPKNEEVFKRKEEKRKVMKKENAYIVKDLLTAPVKSGTATYASMSGWDVAGKTGTTSSDNDRWFAGFTNKYSMAVWYGYDKFEEVRFRGQNPAGLIFTHTMKKIHKNKKAEKFDVPDNVTRVDICKDSGLKPGVCSRDPRGSRIISEVFVKGTEPKDTCKIHVEIEVCKISGLLPTPECLPEDKEKRVFITQESSETQDAQYRAPTQKCTQCKEKNDPKLKEEAEKLKAFQTAIAAISVESKDLKALESVLSKHNALSADNKSKITEAEKEKITKIKERVETLRKEDAEKDKKEAKEVSDLIAKLPAASEITAENADTHSPKVKNARAKYDALSKEAKKLVTNTSKLTEAEKKLKAVKEGN